MRTRHLLTGALWIAVYLVLAFAPLLIALVGPAPPKRSFLAVRGPGAAQQKSV